MHPFDSLSKLSPSVKSNGLSTKVLVTPSRVSRLLRSFDLVTFRYLQKTNEALCLVRNQATGDLKLVLASKLLVYSFGEDAYLLELQRSPTTVSAEEGSHEV
jgi:hypothetical protein